MQGSHAAARCRTRISHAHREGWSKPIFPTPTSYDRTPALDSLEYTHETGREVLLPPQLHVPAKSTCWWRFVPEASMGTAIEMWEAHQHGAAVITISPLKHNWAVSSSATPFMPILPRLNPHCRAARSPKKKRRRSEGQSWRIEIAGSQRLPAVRFTRRAPFRGLYLLPIRSFSHSARRHRLGVRNVRRRLGLTHREIRVDNAVFLRARRLVPEDRAIGRIELHAFCPHSGRRSPAQSPRRKPRSASILLKTGAVAFDNSARMAGGKRWAILLPQSLLSAVLCRKPYPSPFPSPLRSRL